MRAQNGVGAVRRGSFPMDAPVRLTECNLAREVARSGHIDRRHLRAAMLTSPSRRTSPADEWFDVATGHAAHAACGGTLFALGAAGVGLQGWHAVKRLRGGDKG